MSAADLAREFAAINAAIQKSHEVLADMRAERKLMGQMLLDVRAEIKDGVQGLVAAEVKKCVGTDPQSVREGKTPVPDLVQEARRTGAGPALSAEYLETIGRRREIQT